LRRKPGNLQARKAVVQGEMTAATRQTASSSAAIGSAVNGAFIGAIAASPRFGDGWRTTGDDVQEKATQRQEQGLLGKIVAVSGSRATVGLLESTGGAQKARATVSRSS
jgi:hypothetical protein